MAARGGGNAHASLPVAAGGLRHRRQLVYGAGQLSQRKHAGPTSGAMQAARRTHTWGRSCWRCPNAGALLGAAVNTAAALTLTLASRQPIPPRPAGARTTTATIIFPTLFEAATSACTQNLTSPTICLQVHFSAREFQWCCVWCVARDLATKVAIATWRRGWSPTAAVANRSRSTAGTAPPAVEGPSAAEGSFSTTTAGSST